MALLDIQVTIAMASGIPDDAATNIWHFDDAEISGAGEAIAGFLVAFYDSFRTRYSALVAQNGHEIKVYRVSDPEPRAPIYQETFNLSGAPTGSALPPEVAVVLSYHATPVSGIPQARRRGRIYLGPLNTLNVGADGRLATSTLEAVETAVETLVNEINTFGSVKWSTHSKVLGTGAEVTGAWVDNEPDTQRRRGREATIRTLIPVDQV